MINAKRPVRTTIVCGLFFGLVFISLGLLFEHTVFWSLFVRMAVFSCLSVYSFILASWSGTRRICVIFPLLFLSVFIFAQISTHAFLLLCLGMFSWIRSGICFQKSPARSLGVELVFSIGGGYLVACFSPCTPITWGLGIWMFFLVQSLYFIVMTAPAEGDEDMEMDLFEQARIRAENIMKN